MNTDKTKLLICVYLCSSVAIFFFATGCGRYANFTLPEAPGGDTSLVYRFVAQPEPVIARDDFRDALNPSVAGRVNLYSVYDGQWHTALATSEDGAHWRKQGIVLRAAAGDYIAGNGSAVSFGGQFWYWYETGTKDRVRISLARSADARKWRSQAAPVLDVGPVGSWDERAVADPYVVRIEPFFYMYYLGQDRAVRQRIGVARSRDGIHWEKLRANPVVEMDEEEGGSASPRCGNRTVSTGCCTRSAISPRTGICGWRVPRMACAGRNSGCGTRAPRRGTPR
jgi:predicted GH43/DUF377 family glycosyl hydrolase